ncbi:urease accessory protein UreD [Labrys sp. LIt4]|uniref:Urease accessory protein UreD n=1 Tax=Labrys okinawensis TaxID=346911 RepID=A0A2S9QJ25_9HYPH|nr:MULTISPECIES: urease accessory protein UreD [Labrys]MBP0581266.1 urease accessory protein UreD [Labrys sp. LIt4]PRH89320.1 urease accessory protein [Labrys okinawensis]
MYADISCSELRKASPRLERAEGVARLAFRRRAGATRLATLYQEGCAKVRLPQPLPGAQPEAILINTAGGLTGGDSLSFEVVAGPGSSATITTQACERIYRSTGEDAVVVNRLVAEAGARLAWLPQETILFDGGRLVRRLEIDLADGAELLAVEAVLFGRAAMGEVVRSGALKDRWRVRHSGKPIFADDFRIEGDIASRLAASATLGGKRAMATVLAICPEPEERVEEVREIIGSHGGASAWGGKLLVRLLAEDSLALRRRLEPLLSFLLAGRPLPKVWQL